MSDDLAKLLREDEEYAPAKPLAEAPKAVGDIAQRMAKALGDTKLPCGIGANSAGLVIAITNPTDDPLDSFLQALGLGETDECGNPAEHIFSEEKDWATRGFCYESERGV